MIDLHCHSTASDGAFMPSKLPGMAKGNGVSAMALTDHDTTAGLEEFMAAADAVGIEGVPGVELSCFVSSEEKVHIVGLYIDWNAKSMQKLLGQIRVWRDERNINILNKLAEYGKPVSLEEVQEISRAAAQSTEGNEEEVIGRPHIAQAMVNHGYCTCVKDAFRDYLGRGKKAYFDRQTLDAKAGISLIHEAGGLAIWAHPAVSIKSNTRILKIVDELLPFGLDGMETIYPEYTPADTNFITEIVKRHSLLASGGTDFHGPKVTPGISIGRKDDGGFMVPDDFLTQIKMKRK